jgi:L-methionine (R)-S-oxide reductase
MQAELQSILSRFNADTGTIHIVDGEVLVLKAHVGVPPQVVQMVAKIPIGKGMAGLAVERNEPVSSCNLQVDRTGDVQPGAKQTGVNGAVVVPIHDKEGNAVGALGIGVHQQHEYSETEVARLMEEATRLGQLRLS